MFFGEGKLSMTCTDGYVTSNKYLMIPLSKNISENRKRKRRCVKKKKKSCQIAGKGRLGQKLDPYEVMNIHRHLGMIKPMAEVGNGELCICLDKLEFFFSFFPL